MKARRFLPLLITAAGILLAAVALFGILIGRANNTAGQLPGSGVVESGDPMVGQPIPDFELPVLGGGTIQMSDLKGRPVLINYWTTWCPPCKEELPLLQERHDKYPDLVVLAIDTDEEEPVVRDYIEQHGYTFTVLLDFDWSVERLLGVHAYPTSIFVDANGIVRARYIGGMSAKVLDENLALIGVGE